MSFFEDSILENADDIVKDLYADPCKWYPPDGAETVTELAFFNEPTKRDGYGQAGTFVKNTANFEPDAPVVEYRLGQFPGLKEAADAKATQYFEVKGLKFKILKVKRAYGGNTMYAELSKTAQP